MKLISILHVMGEEDEIIVNDESAPIDKMCLFEGDVKECKKQGYFRNGVVTALFAYDNVLVVAVNIEYQKKKAARSDGKAYRYRNSTHLR